MTLIKVTPEHGIDLREVGLVTGTRFPKYGEDATDTLRGNLAEESVRAALEAGYPIENIAFIDSDSNERFLNRIKVYGIDIIPQSRAGMSGGRQQGFEVILDQADSNKQINAFTWFEPEKVDYVRRGIIPVVRPILTGKADIVIPGRTDRGFASIPPFQEAFERDSDEKWSARLWQAGLLPEGVVWDSFFGPRGYSVMPDVAQLTIARHKFRATDSTIPPMAEPQKSYPDATFLPPVAALWQGMNVMAVEIEYEHPKAQTDSEKDSDEMKIKRQRQQDGILFAHDHYIRYLQGDPTSLIMRIS